MIQKMKSVIAAVPKMEKFIVDVCDTCKRTVQSLNQSHAISPKNIIPLLQVWGNQLVEIQSYKELEVWLFEFLLNHRL
jgi:hypothetical protein